MEGNPSNRPRWWRTPRHYCGSPEAWLGTTLAQAPPLAWTALGYSTCCLEADGETFGVGGAAGGGPGLASLRVVKGLAGGVVLGGELQAVPILLGGLLLGGALAEVSPVIPDVCGGCVGLPVFWMLSLAGFGGDAAECNGNWPMRYNLSCHWVGGAGGLSIDFSLNAGFATLTLNDPATFLEIQYQEPLVDWGCTPPQTLPLTLETGPGSAPPTVVVNLVPLAITTLAGGIVLGGDLAPGGITTLAGGVVLGGDLVPVEDLVGGVVLGGDLVPVEDLVGGVVLGGDLVPAPYWTYYNAAGSYSFDPSIPGTATIYAVGGGGAGSVHVGLMGGGRGGDSAQYVVHLSAGSYAVVVGAGGPLTGVGGADSYWEAGAACLAAGGAPGNPTTSGGGITTSGSTSLGDTTFSGGNGGTGTLAGGGGGGSSAGDSAAGNPGSNGLTAAGGVAPTGGGNGGHGYKVALGAAQAGFTPGGGGGGGLNANASAAGADGKVWVYFVPD